MLETRYKMIINHVSKHQFVVLFCCITYMKTPKVIGKTCFSSSFKNLLLSIIFSFTILNFAIK